MLLQVVRAKLNENRYENYLVVCVRNLWLQGADSIHSFTTER